MRGANHRQSFANVRQQGGTHLGMLRSVKPVHSGFPNLSPRRCNIFCGCWLTLLLLAAAGFTARATVYELTVNPAASSLEVAPSSFDGLEFVAAEMQATNSLQTTFTGTIRLEITNGTAQLLPGSELIVANNGDWYPGPFTYNPSNPREFNTNTGPANYAYRYVVPLDIHVAVRQLRFTPAHNQPVPFADQSFASAGVTMTIPVGYGDLTMGNPPQSNLATYPPTNTTSTNTAVLTDAGGAVTLTLPLQFEWQLISAITIKTVYEGVVVAQSGTVPLPELKMERLANGEVKVSWLAAVTGFNLTTTSNLAANLWSPVNLAPVLEVDRLTVTLAATNQQQYFRLQQP